MAEKSILIPDLSSEFEFQTSRSSGPGGQNVNKVNSRVELRFNIPASQVLNDDQKTKLLDKLASRLTNDGTLILAAQKERSQVQNKERVIERFYNLLAKSLRPVRKRKATKPTRSSIEKRLNNKKQKSEKKRLRGKIDS
ncbi:MAG TPA: alternative ribosome rescue aminoacyl-tRNA hydrolase ArfB [Sunxiuqinia sp.]|nr:alternative ribosome rescue aminoacyl-tRNA hydrolase ArfB [Sunxiuqinia sp.]